MRQVDLINKRGLLLEKMEVQVHKTVVMDKMEMMAIVMMDIVMVVMLVVDMS